MDAKRRKTRGVFAESGCWMPLAAPGKVYRSAAMTRLFEEPLAD